jgi:hypothetical protein
MCVTATYACRFSLSDAAALDNESASAALRSHFHLLLNVHGMIVCHRQEGQQTDQPVVKETRPSHVLLAPLKARFNYHFMSSRQTNSLAHPEWYLQQVRLWLVNSGRFAAAYYLNRSALDQRVGNADDRPGREEWLLVQRGLLELTAEKLREDLPALERDEALLGHAVDEVLAFARDQHVQEAVASVKATHDGQCRWAVVVLVEEPFCQRCCFSHTIYICIGFISLM